MLSINKIVISGHLGRDPLVGATPRGVMVAKFSVAVANAGKPAWFQCVATGQWAELMRDRFGQGDAIYLEGSVEPYEWAPRGSRQKNSAVRIRVDRIKRPYSLSPNASMLEPAATAMYSLPSNE